MKAAASVPASGVAAAEDIPEISKPESALAASAPPSPVPAWKTWEAWERSVPENSAAKPEDKPPLPDKAEAPASAPGVIAESIGLNVIKPRYLQIPLESTVNVAFNTLVANGGIPMCYGVCMGLTRS